MTGELSVAQLRQHAACLRLPCNVVHLKSTSEKVASFGKGEWCISLAAWPYWSGDKVN